MSTVRLVKTAQVGRVCLITDGPLKGQLGVIVDIMDQNRALMDGPAFQRRIIRFRRLHLSRFTLKVPVNAKHAAVVRLWKEAGLGKAIAESQLGQKLHQQRRKEGLSEFQRFKESHIRRKLNRRVDALARKLMMKESLKGQRVIKRTQEKYGKKAKA